MRNKILSLVQKVLERCEMPSWLMKLQRDVNLSDMHSASESRLRCNVVFLSNDAMMTHVRSNNVYSI